MRIKNSNLNEDMRLKGEIYTIIRTLQYVMLTKDQRVQNIKLNIKYDERNGDVEQQKL